jgi:hypothetical protein
VAGLRGQGQSAFWRHRRPSARTDLSPGATTCQTIDFRPSGPTILMATVIVAVQSNKLYQP